MNISADGIRVLYPLFQAGDDGSNPISALNFLILPATHKTAKMFIEKWHYSHRMPTGKNINFGLYANTELYAIIVYGIGVNPYQAQYLGVNTAIEIKRLCRKEPALSQYPLSRFISLTAKMVSKIYPYDCIVAFADPEQGHRGSVYKASGFQLHGLTNAEWHLIDGDGLKRHRRFAFRHARRNKKTIGESREELNLTRVQTQPKYRWVRYVSRPDHD